MSGWVLVRGACPVSESSVVACHLVMPTPASSPKGVGRVDILMR